MKRPLVPVALCYAAGLLLAEFFHPSLAMLFLVSFTLLIAALSSSRQRMFLLWPLLVLVVWEHWGIAVAAGLARQIHYHGR